jgi:4-amino-4-deoxy-L-arabinose transferase-like glycosyltransferase
MSAKFSVVKLGLAVWLAALAIVYGFRIGDIPFVRVDDGALLEVSRTYAAHGYLGSRMFETGHHESAYFHVHPPVFYLLNGLVMKALGFGVLQARLLSLFCAFLILAVAPFLYWLILKKRLTADEIMLLAVMFLGNPFYFVLARYVRPEMLTVLLALLAMTAYHLAALKDNRYWLVPSGILAGLSVLTHFFGLYAFIYIAVQLLVSHKEGKLRRGALLVAGFLLPLIPYIIWLSRDLGSFYYQVIVARQSLAGFTFSRIFGRYLAFFLNFKTWNVTIMCLALVPVALWRRASVDWVAVGRASVPICCFLPIFILMPRLSEYYYLAVLPFLYYIALVLKRALGRPVAMILVAFILVNLFGLAYYWQRYHDYDYAGYIHKIRASLPAPGNFALLGSSSLFPGLNDYSFYALDNGSLAGAVGQTYAGFASRAKELDIQYIIYQETDLKQPFHASFLARYLKERCRLLGQVFDRGYGSEGQKLDNYTYIYKAL